ncbi:Imm7 family immunity protein [Paenibacillus urinalis]|uniref:Imm7 family immunity protein n=1 Tax=Paenibacillus urinalis TaxID=521520 RepID=UPI001960AC5D
MYEYHGWATIRESSSIEDDELNLAILIKKIQEYINELQWPTGVLDLRIVNGEYQLWIAGLNNHKPTDKHHPLKVFSTIGTLAPGSYGILYVRDSDDLEHYNEFKVHSLVRGTVTEHADPFLSPVIPKLEDET